MIEILKKLKHIDPNITGCITDDPNNIGLLPDGIWLRHEGFIVLQYPDREIKIETSESVSITYEQT